MERNPAIFPFSAAQIKPSNVRRRARRSAPKTLRGSGFTQKDTGKFLFITNKFLPLFKDEREAVLLKHNKLFSHISRSFDSLKRNFSTLNWKIMTTGDQLMTD